MPLLTEDRALLLAFRAGEASALERVFRHYAPEVNTCLTQGFAFESEGRTLRFAGYRDSSEAMSMMHEVFRRAFEPEARKRYDGLRPFGAWVRRIARNLVISELRRSGRTQSLEAIAESQGAPPEGGEGLTRAEAPPGPEEVTERKEVARVVREFLESLPEKGRSLLRLRFEQSKSQTEAGQALGMSRMTVRTQEKHLRRALLEHLKETGMLDVEAGAPSPGEAAP